MINKKHNLENYFIRAINNYNKIRVSQNNGQAWYILPSEIA